MSRKLKQVSELAAQTAGEITAGEENWKQFLTLAARLNTYSFDDQVLIYAQRPDAAACAYMNEWNEKMHRWVMRGSKGIALIRKGEGGKPYLDYVFDVADTRPVHGARIPYRWELQEEQREEVAAALEVRFGKTTGKGFLEKLTEIAGVVAAERYQAAFADMGNNTGNTVEESVFRDTLADSVRYMLFVRCGLKAEAEELSLRGIGKFSDPETLYHLGDAVSTVSTEILLEIGKTVRRIDKEKAEKQTEKSEKTLAKTEEILYTDSRGEFNTLIRESEEGSEENGSVGIQQERGIPDPGSGHGWGGAGERDDREVRVDARALSSGTSSRNLHSHAPDGQAEVPPSGNRQAGPGAGGADRKENDGRTGREREAESGKSDAVGTEGQQSDGHGRGDSASGNRISLEGQQRGFGNRATAETAGEQPAVSASDTDKQGKQEEFQQLSLFPTLAEQIADISRKRQAETIEKETLALSGKITPVPDEVIERALTAGGNEFRGILQIVAYFQSPDMTQGFLDMLQEAYGQGGKGVHIDGEEYALWFGKKGIYMAAGRRVTVSNSTLVTWERAGEIIGDLLERGAYVSQETLEAAWEDAYQRAAEDIWYLRQNLSKKARELHCLPEINRCYDSNVNFFDFIEKLPELLKNEQGLETILAELEEFTGSYKEDPELLRFHGYQPENIYNKCMRFRHPPRSFRGAQDFEPVKGSFITENEIDRALCEESSGIDRKMRIYSWFMQGYSAGERADFLKKEYGTSGSGEIGDHKDYNGKGLAYTRRDGFSKSRDYARIKLSWNEVEKRIDKLISEGRYLTAEEMAYTTEYEKQKLAGRIYDFYYEAAGQKPGGFDRDPIRGAKEFRPMLDNETYTQGLYEDMAEIFAKLPSDGSVRDYDEAKATLADMDAYRRGDYSLFKPLPGISYAVQEKEGTQGKRKPEAKTKAPEGQLSLFSALAESEAEEQERQNFRILDGALGEGGLKTKYQNNVAAIRLLKQLEADGRFAVSKEQEILSRYVGWGGLAQVFDPGNEKWTEEFTELKALLTEEEYESARSTVLNAYYTSPVIIRAVYEAVSQMGITPENILEPSCGIGNFFGLIPETFQNAGLYGVELDSLTGRIAAQLYQKAEILHCGFEETPFLDDHFDLAIGNVPFGEYGVHDRKYDKEGLLIHDYFFLKTLDKLRPGGIAAMITTKGTMDKKSDRVRRLLAERADLLGAIRLPDSAFLKNAGAEVTTDILFFQKREAVLEHLPEWIATGETENGITMNQYFIKHPEMVLGEMAFTSTRYGQDTVCRTIEGTDLAAQLSEAVSHIRRPDESLLKKPVKELEQEETEEIPADPDVRNYSFVTKDGRLYFRENTRMVPVQTGKRQTERIQGMMEIRDCTRKLIELQMQGADDKAVAEEQKRLNLLYDQFKERYGILNSAGNRLAFRQDASYPLLCSLEILDEEGKFEAKADMFTRRTIMYHKPATHADTAVEAFGISLGERACVDLEFMAGLMGGKEKIPDIIADLKGAIFKDPATGPFALAENEEDSLRGWQAADEYLSGNVREKLETAREAAKTYPEFAVNVEALKKAQPKELTASEISVRIGAPWVDIEYYRQFMYELFKTPKSLRGPKRIDLQYSDVTGEWHMSGKGMDHTNSLVSSTYGTKRISGYALLEAALNQRSIQIYDTEEDENGREIRVLNQKETIIAQQKQDAIKEAFQNWIFKDPDRRADLCSTYNRMFNSIRPRTYDGSHIVFGGMNPEITLEEHQKNAVARILYGGNSLLAHVVGAGKTYEMAAAAMESKRLGLCRKSMFVVPNHLTEQWGSEFLQLYPGAKLLVATKKDFEPLNRKKFCARIATGDFDAVIIGHSQFEKIPLSVERQRRTIENQVKEITEAIREADREEKYMVRQLERTKKSLEASLKRLADIKQDDTVTFEELGVDRLFVDEAHSFKNLFIYTKMRNVAGISQTAAKKSSDMFSKCRYLDEITGSKGVIFATGTPVSNSMVELYTMMRYLQYEMLEQGYRDSAGKLHSLKHFDNWAATFGEQVTAVELKPEGTGFRLKTRFAKFYNLPELMNLWKEAADIQTADMLHLPVPEAEYITIQTEPSEAQKEMVQALAERAEKIRGGNIDPTIDNMLKVTSDGRKLALDQRILNPLLPDYPGSKVNACVEKVFTIWEETAAERSTQLIFSDLSTPKGRAETNKADAQSMDGEGTEQEDTAEESKMMTSIYEDIRDKLRAKGIPKEEIAFIHDAHTETQKAELFAKVRSGKVRVLLGSTQKMGVGTNVQTKLIAIHDLDAPWRPLDLEQRAGRVVRRGNENEKVWIHRYVTKGTFDAYIWVRHEVA